MKELIQRLTKTKTLSTIALCSMFGCLGLAVIDATLRDAFFKIAAGNLGAYIALQQAETNRRHDDNDD